MQGAGRGKSRKMAKKGAAAALQTEVNTDEEWEQVLHRTGLLLVDVYSEWSGPCTGMVSILKKVKMEMGGDSLSYAVAKSDMIKQLARFRGKSEPTWMFVRDGKMINIMFGANCPKLMSILLTELSRVQNNEPPELSMPVYEMSPYEIERKKQMEEARRIRDAEKNAILEAEAKKKYDAMMEHLTSALKMETLIILFPWVFMDEDGKLRDKKNSPAYVELVQQLLPRQFYIDQEIKRELDQDILEELQRETPYELSEDTKRLMMDDKAMILRLRAKGFVDDLDGLLIKLVYDVFDPVIPHSIDELEEGCFVQHHLPPLRELGHCGEEEGYEDDVLCLTTVWIPFNIRNRVLAFRALFTKYIETNYPRDDEDEVPVVIFKYDATKRKELSIALEQYEKEVVSFGIFERDTVPNPRRIAKSIKGYEERVQVKTGYEVFVALVKKVSNEAFLSFAGIGPYYISETQEKALEEAEQFFPRESGGAPGRASEDDGKEGEEGEGESEGDEEADEDEAEQ
ncbi:hypothetical protein QAD02_019038 [Eretmocerus hayati]|uniref:Uncharacterized protein n=1 Tax=Eretmocerus hayati TaxID=131215 RepID=A0ACC2PKB3_9HYME|nr:hypothetical protein QAD02_019038 [Eretmocerus hayati]